MIPFTFAQVLDILREALVHTQSNYARSQSAYHSFQLRLDATETEMHQWHKRILRHYNLLHKQQSSDCRLLMAAAEAVRIREIFETGETRAAKSTSAARQEPPRPRHPVITTVDFRQNVQITVKDGQVTTAFDLNGRHWLNKNLWQNASSFIRHYYFPDAEIPARYAFVLEHRGLHYGPTKTVFIRYSPAEFQRICQSEVDTGTPHALDGERLGYHRLSEKEPIERPINEEE